MCKSCKSKVTTKQNTNLPLFEARSTSKDTSKVVITTRSKITLDVPEGNIQLTPGNVLLIEAKMADELIEKGAPIWVLSKR